MLYEVSLCIRKVKTSSKLSYYERWLINGITHNPYFQPILDTVFERNVRIAPEPESQWYLLVEAPGSSTKHEAAAFKKGRELIREHLKNEVCFIIEE